MAYDSKTFEADLNLLKTYLGPDTRDDILDQLRELARQVRAMQALIAGMAGERQPSPEGAALQSLGKATQPERLVLLKKALLGARGGQRIPYHKDLAYRLLAKALITLPQHKVWKKTGLLPDHVDVRQGRAENTLMARPA